MTSTQPDLKSFPGAVLGEELGDLAEILRTDVQLASWRRAENPRITSFLEQQEFSLPQPSRSVVRSSDPEFPRRVAELIPTGAAESDPAGSASLANDIEFVCQAFSDLVAADELMISLEQPGRAMCPRFHVDQIGIRMLVTYQGPGTEWIPNEHVDRRWLGAAGMDLPDGKDGAIRAGAEIVRLPRFAVVLLKGEAWPNAAGLGAVHRSPDTGSAPRTLLRVDMLTQLPIEDSDKEIAE